MRKSLVFAIAVTLLTALAGPGLAQRAGEVVGGRVAGGDRIATAVAISQRAFPDGAVTAYLAHADDPVDAVAGGSLTDGPILLVPTCGTLPVVVAEELRRLVPDEVLALGGDAAVCDEMLAQAVVAAGDGPPAPGAPAAVTVTATLVDATRTPPFTLAITDPGTLAPGDTAAHTLTFTGTNGTVYLDDPRFSTALDDSGLVATGRGCGSAGDGAVTCTDDFAFIEVSEGEDTQYQLALHAYDDTIQPGTYHFDQPVHWGDTNQEATFDGGRVLVRLTYTVSR